MILGEIKIYVCCIKVTVILFSVETAAFW